MARYLNPRNDHVRGLREKTEKCAPLIMPELRAALGEIMASDPHRFVACLVQAQVVSLRQIPAWVLLSNSEDGGDRLLARQIAVLAEDRGIHCRAEVPPL